MSDEKELLVIDQSQQNDNEEFDDKAALSALRRYRVIDVNMVRVFFVILFAGAIIALLPFFRPSYSDSEQRELEKFPRFSFSLLFSGDYFEKIELWFSDTFPFREKFITLNAYITNSFGNSDIEIHGELEQGDVIPDVESTTTENDDVKENECSSSAQEQSDASSQTSVSVPSSKPTATTQPTNTTEQIGAVLIVGNSGYEYYNFVQKYADVYASAVSRIADQFAGQINVYDIVVPTSTGVTLDKSVALNINSSNQKAAIKYIYSRLSSNVRKIDAYSALEAHRNEYIYFRTDHHWTALGAYYTYCELMLNMGKIPNSLSSYNAYEFKGFLGSFYRSTGKSPKLGATPDTVYAYGPKNTANILITLKSQYGQIFQKEFPIIRDGNAMNEGSKYLSFIAADQPLGVIKNPSITDGSVCTVVKESYGNCFVPFLAENYSTVYVIDYRHYPLVDSRSLRDFALQTGTRDLIFINNVSATRNADLVNGINNLIPVQ